MLKKGLLFLLTGSFLLPAVLFAAEAFNLQTLQNLFNTYKRKQAYNYATQYIDQMEGDPVFDYIYGVSAIDSGHASEGVFALERVLLAFPEDHVARLELARGYFILEEYARSREEFETVLATSPPEGVVETTQNYLDAIRLKEARYQTTSNGYVELGIGSDSNVNSGLNQDELSLLAAFTFDDTSVEQDDTYASLTASYQVTHPFAAGWMFNAELTGNTKKNSDWDQFDTTTLSLQTGVTRLFKKSTYKAKLFYQTFDLDSDDYRNMTGLGLDWRYMLTQQSNLTTSLQWSQQEYEDLDNKNSDLIALSVGYDHAFSTFLSPLFFANINLGQEQADEDTAAALSDTERDIMGLRMGVVLSFTNKLALQTSAGYQNSEYAGENTTLALFGTTGVVRDDDYVSADMNLLWLFQRDWRMDTRFSYVDNRSNVESNAYDRTLFSVNFNYAF